MMLIVGDIGATTTRLALTSTEKGPREFLREQEFHTADFKGLRPVVEAFFSDAGARADHGCFDVAGPVVGGRAHLTNLSWAFDEKSLQQDLKLKRVTLLNDLHAIAYAVPHLRPEETVVVNAGEAIEKSAIAARRLSTPGDDPRAGLLGLRRGK